MKVVLQNVSSASVTIDGVIHGAIDNGYVILVGFTHGDDKIKVKSMVDKLIKLRVIPDGDGNMNLSINDVGGKILSISQFTLYANTNKGNRPSFVDALNPSLANELYDYFNEYLNDFVEIETGVFGADMQVSLVNAGPITIVLEK
jgi:D-tyrosyl-tRNA(Tyr) deacylase